MNCADWRKRHGEVIAEFLQYLNKHSEEYILKGGTALMMCYGLDRFSEDIDLDCAQSKAISEITKRFCEERGYSCRIAKDTSTVKRYLIDYGGREDENVKKLKVEVSYRRKTIGEKDCIKINGIKVYTLDNLAIMKAGAYSARDKLRDLYDVTFIGNHYWDSLSEGAQTVLRNCIEFKGIEQFDYLVNTQKDELISLDKLADDFLKLLDRLELLVTEEEKAVLEEEQEMGLGM